MSKQAMLLTGFLACVVLVSAPEASWAQGLLVTSSQMLRGTSSTSAAQFGPSAVAQSIARPVPFQTPTVGQDNVRRFFPLPPAFRPLFTPSGRPLPLFGFQPFSRR